MQEHERGDQTFPVAPRERRPLRDDRQRSPRREVLHELSALSRVDRSASVWRRELALLDRADEQRKIRADAW